MFHFRWLFNSCCTQYSKFIFSVFLVVNPASRALAVDFFGEDSRTGYSADITVLMWLLQSYRSSPHYARNEIWENSYLFSELSDSDLDVYLEYILTGKLADPFKSEFVYGGQSNDLQMDSGFNSIQFQNSKFLDTTDNARSLLREFYQRYKVDKLIRVYRSDPTQLNQPHPRIRETAAVFLSWMYEDAPTVELREIIAELATSDVPAIRFAALVGLTRAGRDRFSFGLLLQMSLDREPLAAKKQGAAYQPYGPTIQQGAAIALRRHPLFNEVMSYLMIRPLQKAETNSDEESILRLIRNDGSLSICHALFQ